ncbi:hypothetical protein D3C79_858880 [compost metagenome]
MVELLVTDLADVFARYLLARDVHQDVEAAELFVGLVDQFLAERFIFQIARDGHHFTALRLDQLDDFTGVGLLDGQVVEGNVRTFTSKGNGHCPADAGICASNQCLATGQTAEAFVGAFAVVGFGVHVGVQTRG